MAHRIASDHLRPPFPDCRVAIARPPRRVGSSRSATCAMCADSRRGEAPTIFTSPSPPRRAQGGVAAQGRPRRIACVSECPGKQPFIAPRTTISPPPICSPFPPFHLKSHSFQLVILLYVALWINLIDRHDAPIRLTLASSSTQTPLTPCDTQYTSLLQRPFAPARHTSAC